ncbi:hypothetical protein [Pantoea vagans]|uniref:hypothetical protein n=1 Tax=Pantoea vagans TaxID=470934 RepID=UPI003FA3D58D
MSTVHIVKVISPEGWTPVSHHAVEEEGTEKLLFECSLQEEAIEWAKSKKYTYEIHRERNRKSTDKHGQFREQ